MKKVSLALTILAFSIKLFAQETTSESKIKFTCSLNMKEVISFNNIDSRSYARDLFVGIKVLDLAVLDIGIGDLNKYNIRTLTYEHNLYYGLSLKYQYFFKEKPLTKDKLMIEPALSINKAINQSSYDHFYFYTLSANFVYSKLPNFHISYGFMHQLGQENNIGFHLGLGIRI